MAVSAARVPPVVCATCTGTDSLRPRQLDPGGPVYIICRACDEGEEIPDPSTPEDTGIHPKVLEILRAVSLLEWPSAIEIAEHLGIPGNIENRKARNGFSALICRAHRRGLLRSRDGVSTRGRRGYREYQLTDLGKAALR